MPIAISKVNTVDILAQSVYVAINITSADIRRVAHNLELGFTSYGELWSTRGWTRVTRHQSSPFLNADDFFFSIAIPHSHPSRLSSKMRHKNNLPTEG
jgi:hypothetical protein